MGEGLRSHSPAPAKDLLVSRDTRDGSYVVQDLSLHGCRRAFHGGLQRTIAVAAFRSYLEPIADTDLVGAALAQFRAWLERAPAEKERRMAESERVAAEERERTRRSEERQIAARAAEAARAEDARAAEAARAEDARVAEERALEEQQAEEIERRQWQQYLRKTEYEILNGPPRPYEEIQRVFGVRWIPYAFLLRSTEWKACRTRILARDGHACTQCGRAESEAGLEVHHRDYGAERRLPWEYPDLALAILCHSCHSRTHGWLDD